MLEGKVSARAAREDYGVILTEDAEGEARVDDAATRALRAERRAARGPQPFFDRGPGYRQLAGADHASVDFLDGTQTG